MTCPHAFRNSTRRLVWARSSACKRRETRYDWSCSRSRKTEAAGQWGEVEKILKPQKAQKAGILEWLWGASDRNPALTCPNQLCRPGSSEFIRNFFPLDRPLTPQPRQAQVEAGPRSVAKSSRCLEDQRARRRCGSPGRVHHQIGSDLA